MTAANYTVPYRLLSACLLILGTRVTPLTAVNPCEASDGSGVTQLYLNFTESYGRDDHLAPTHEERSLGQIYGTVRHVNDTAAAGADTVVLTPRDVLFENKFCNKTQFSPLETFFAGVAIRSGVAYIKLKRGIDREMLDIYIAEMPGVTVTDASILFHIECTPDAPTFSARNFSVQVRINDLNDNSPAFYNASGSAGDGSSGSGSLTNCQQPDKLKQGNFTVTVRQNTPRGVLVFSGAVARDRDASLNAQVRVVTLQPNPYFEAAAGAELRVHTKRQVYYDSFDAPGGVTMRLLAVAEDSPANASHRLSSTATITITIVDEEDLPPAFVVPGCRVFKSLCVSPAYSASVTSGVKTTGPLSISPGPIQAVNRDALQHSIRYSLLAAGDDLQQPSFWIDRDSGLVTQLQPICRQVVLVVKATKWTEQSENLHSERYCVALLVVSVNDTSNSSTTVTASTEDSDVTTAAPPISQPLVPALIAVCGVQTALIIATVVMLLILWLAARKKQKPTASPDQPPVKAKRNQDHPQLSVPAPSPDDQGNNNSSCAAPTSQSDKHSIAYDDLEISVDNSKHRDFAQRNSIAVKDDYDETGDVLMTLRTG